MLIESEYQTAEPARTVYKRGLQKKVNLQACRKSEGIVQTESLGESLILVAGEIDPRVRRIMPQPVVFDLNNGATYSNKAALSEAIRGKRYKPWVYTPDFLFDLVNGDRVFVEGKHTRWLRANPEFGAVLSAMTELGHRIAVVTEQLFPRCLHRNLRILRAMPDKGLAPTTKTRLKTCLPDKLSFGTAQSLFGLTRSEVYAALLEGILSTDLARAPFNQRTQLVRAEGDLTHLQVLPL